MSASLRTSRRPPCGSMLRVSRAASPLTALLILLSAACTAGHALPATGKEEYVVCSSPVCLQRAQEIKESLNLRADPCEDFYSYACGGWMKNHTIPESKSQYGSTDILKDALQETLRGILGNMTLVYGDNQNTIDKAVLAYNACMAIPEAGDQYELMRQMINDLGLAGWPLLSKEEQRPVKELNWTQMFRKFEPGTFLKMAVGRDSTYKTSNVIKLGEGDSIILGRNQLIHPNKEGNKAIIAAYKKLIAAAAKFMSPNITKPQANMLADDIVDFEGKLANLTSPSEDVRDTLAIYHRTTIGALQKKFPHFPILAILNKRFKAVNITLNETEPLETYSLEYYGKLAPFLQKAKPSTIFNYIGMTTILPIAKYASEDSREAFLELNKAASGVQKDTPWWKECVGLVNLLMPEVTGYLYVTKNFRKEAKMEVEDIVHALKEAFNETLRNSTWMDVDTRSEANLKLREMGMKIGYPHWLLNSSSLDELYKYIPTLNNTTHFLSMLQSISDIEELTMLAKLRKAYDADEFWSIALAIVNAFNDVSGNGMVCSAGILQGVFYQYGLPRSINMGAIGSVMGHELTHGFDDRGSRFDAKGRLREWWSHSSRQKFRKMSQCFVKQYGSIYDREAGMKLNGENSIGENIADNGGLRTAFRAYKNILKEHGEKDTRLKGLEKLSGDKMFFIANAMLWCKLVRPEQKKLDIQYDQHSPTEYRINIPMRNMVEFSKVFNCPAHSGMNPDRNKTCTLW